MASRRKLPGGIAAMSVTIFLSVVIYLATGDMIIALVILGVSTICAIGLAMIRSHIIRVERPATVTTTITTLAMAAAAQGVTICPMTGEANRRRAYNLLSSQINDPSLMAYLPERNAVLMGQHIEDPAVTILAAVEEDGNVVGAAYFGPEWNEVIKNERGNIASAEQSLAAYEAVTILHGIATTPVARGKGYGRLLMRAVEEHVLHRGGLAIAGVAEIREIGFYERCGYTPLGRGVALVMNPAAKTGKNFSPIALPIIGASQWFAKALVGEGAVGGYRQNPTGEHEIFGLTQGDLTDLEND